MNKFKWELIIRFAFLLFCFSILLLIVATIRWRSDVGQVPLLNVVDMATAFAVCILGIVIYRKGFKIVKLRDWQNSYIIATFLPVLALVAIWLSLSRVTQLDVLLPGLAWRLFVLLQTLPAAMAIWHYKEESIV
jgi:hypothetical protein